MITKQTVCLRKLGGTRAGEVKLGRWFSNERVTKEELADSITEKVKALVRNKHILAIQDTTELNYESKINRIEGLGPVGNGRTNGFYLHPMLAIDADKGICLGLASIKSWVRTEIKKKTKGNIYRKQRIEDKESYKWIETSDTAKKVLVQAKQITIIADRESDIYEEWCRIPGDKTHLLTRACQDRGLSNGKRLFSHVTDLKNTGTYEFKVKARKGKRTAHVAKMEIRFGEVEIKKSPKCTDKEAPKAIKLRVVDVRERAESVFKNEEPIHWCLLTTHKVESTEKALEIVNWYCQRWHIEQFFRTLQKQGLDVESSQVEAVSTLMKLVTVACFAALKIMQLTLARDGKDQAISIVFNASECKLLSKLQKKLEGKTEKQKNPFNPKLLSWATWIIARLGGWKGYASESVPGPITLSRGFKQFQTIYEGLTLIDVCID